MTAKTLTVAFTGHRPNKIYGYLPNAKEKYSQLVEHFKQMVRNLYATGVRTFITGGAQGFDQLMFWAVYHVQKEPGFEEIKNVIHIPFEGQSRTWSEDGYFGQTCYKKMLELADEVVNVASVKNIDIEKRNGAVNALMERNKSMIDAADLLVGFYHDGSAFIDETVKGGTANALRYAFKETSKDIYIFDPKTCTIEKLDRAALS